MLKFLYCSNAKRNKLGDLLRSMTSKAFMQAKTLEIQLSTQDLLSAQQMIRKASDAEQLAQYEEFSNA